MIWREITRDQFELTEALQILGGVIVRTIVQVEENPSVALTFVKNATVDRDGKGGWKIH